MGKLRAGGSMENTSTNESRKHFKDQTSHSNVRKGLEDYNDGANVTHHLGNDDYGDGNNLPEPFEQENNKLDGKVAEGNDLTDEDISS